MYANLWSCGDGRGVLRREEHKLPPRVAERVADQQVHHYLSIHIVL